MSNTASKTEEAEQTDAMIRAGASAGTNRQCSIRWHSECSDLKGCACRCSCPDIVGMAQHAAGDMKCPATAVLVIDTDGEPHVTMTPETTITTVRTALKIALEALDTQEAEEAKEAAKLAAENKP